MGIIIGLLIASLLIIFLTKNNLIFPIALFIFFACFGFTLIYAKTHIFHETLLKKNLFNQTFFGIVENIENRKILLKTEKTKLSLICFNKDGIRKGDQIEVLCDLYPFQYPATPWSFNRKRDAYYQGIYSSGRIKKITQHIAHNKFSIREKIANNIKENIADKDVKAIALAISIGDKSYLSNDLRSKFANAGTAHLLAISGLHLSLVVGIVFVFMRFFIALIPGIARLHGSFKIAAFIALLFSLFYMVLSGMSYPTIRACIMTGLLMLGIMIDRITVSLRSLALAATVILLLKPEAIVSASFQLSFGAVLPLITLWEILGVSIISLKGYKKTLMWIFAPIITSFITSSAIIPFSIVIFNQLTLHSVLGNIFAIPLFTFCVMPLMLLCIFISNIFYTPLAYSIKLLIYMTSYVGDLPGACIHIAQPNNLFFLGFIVFGGLWLCLMQQKWRYYGLAAIVSGILCYRPIEKPEILISLKNVVFKEGKQYMAINKRKDKFVLSEWEKIYKIDIHKAATLPKYIYVIEDYKNIEFDNQDKDVRLVLSPCYVKRKIEKRSDQIVIDRDSIEKNGNHFIYKNGEIKTIRSYFGNRLYL